MGGRLPGLAQQNVSNLPSRTSNLGAMRRSWHYDSDIYTVRQFIIEKTLQLFQRRQINQEWQQRLLDFVRRLEEGLFKYAASKEEYMDLSTLERRAQTLVKRVAPFRSRNQNLGHHNPSVGTMIPTPGLQQNGNASSMIPTPGTATSTVNVPGSGNLVTNTVGMGNMMQNNNDNAGLIRGSSMLASDVNSSKMVPTPGLSGNIFSTCGDNIASLPGQLNNAFHSQQGIGNISTGAGNHMIATMGLPRVGSQMIPTPGLSAPQSIPMNCTSSGGLGQSNGDPMSAAQQQQQFSGAQSSRVYHNINGQVAGTMGINMQPKNSSYGMLNGSMNNGMQMMSGNQHLMNGTGSLPNSGSYMNTSRFGNLQLPSQQHLNQQRQQQLMQLSHQISPLASDGYAMNAADLAGSGNLYNNVATSGGLAAASNLNSNSLGIQSKMIPVPGLSSQQPQAQQQGQQHKSQSMDNSQQINFQMHRGQLMPQYQQLHQPYQQNVQHQLQQYQQQHHHNQQSQNQQQSLLQSDDVQSIQPSSKLSGPKHSGIGSQPQAEGLQQFISQAGDEALYQATGTQNQQCQVKGPQMHQDLPNLQQLCPQLSQKPHQQPVTSSPQQQETQSQHDSNNIPIEAQAEVVLESLHESQSQEKRHLTEQGQYLAEQQQLPQEVEQITKNHEGTDNTHQSQQSSANGAISTITNIYRVET